MLLPEPQRSSLPFVASLTLQASLVLLLAIPWTVATLQSNGPIQILSILKLPVLKPAEPEAAAVQSKVPNPQLKIPTETRPFRAPSTAVPASIAALPAAPELRFDRGLNTTVAGAGLFSVAAVKTPEAAATPKALPVNGTPAQVAVGGRVQEARLIRRVQPVYPALARQVRVQGVVLLEAIIGVDGTIQQLRALSGHPLLIPSAIQAVQQWVYRPTVLNDKPVEVKTTIEVRFTIS